MYINSQRAGERVLHSVTNCLAKRLRRLRLTVNQDKSPVDRSWNRKFLGFTFTTRRKRSIAPAARAKFKKRIRELTKRNRGSSAFVLAASGQRTPQSAAGLARRLRLLSDALGAAGLRQLDSPSLEVLRMEAMEDGQTPVRRVTAVGHRERPRRPNRREPQRLLAPQPQPSSEHGAEHSVLSRVRSASAAPAL